MARVAAASRKKTPLFRLLSLMAVSWACLQTAQPLWALAGPIVRCSSRPSSSTSSSISTGGLRVTGAPCAAFRPHRQLRPLPLPPRRALQEAEQGEGGDDEDQEPAPATADPVEGAKQDLAAARQLRDLAISGLQTAQDALQFVRAQWENAVQANDTEAAEKWETKVERAEATVDRAKVELDRAKQEVEKAKEAAKASVPAGRGQAGASACAVVAVAFGLQHSSMVTVCFLGLSS
eukprot:s9928_g1.t1